MHMSGDLASLGTDFWTWRAGTQPVAGDDIPRIERPSDWAPDWSRSSVEAQRADLAALRERHTALSDQSQRWPVDQQVDYRLLGSALSRVEWELDVIRGWQHNPYFYVHQTIGAVFELLLQPPPFDARRQDALVQRAEAIPAMLESARANLAGEAIRPFAELAIGALANIGPRLETVARELSALLDAPHAPRMTRALLEAAARFEAYRSWLADGLSSMPGETAIGREAYTSFLTRVALIPLTPEEIMAGARQELERAVTFEALEQQRNRGLPPQPLAATQAEWIEREAAGEDMLRDFCEAHDLLSFPDWLRRYRNAPLPGYLAPLRGLGVTDDLTSPTRLDQDGLHYIPEPAPDLPYFYLAMARDPRTLIAHEGMHYYQLALSWAHPDRLRRFYYDSGPNEGIGFYAEEMLLQAGLFDDNPRSREIIYNFMRLRALRVSVDVRLALGELTVGAAARELATRVPMDAGTAYEEASFFASSPGQAITYQVGKMQILGFLSDARSAQAADFNLRAFHDRLWQNGNVPIALQRWELLGSSNVERRS
ncbi:MAG: DUF885 family protein [Chloroflexi bacterium]|nr:DUF885 family protein [Chloroflexota bacterium]MBV9596266.1 DUF885 family protein [Chloroflexota bacterium]